MSLRPLFGVALEKLGADTLAALAPTFRSLVVDHASLRGSGSSSSSIVTAPGIRDSSPSPASTSGLVVYPFSSTDRQFKIGRSATLAEIVIRDSRVSKQHAVVAPDGERTWVWDLNSSNGTFIDERCLAPGEAGRALVPLGHHFWLGDVGVLLLDAAGLRKLAQK